eukprot:COSAG02_NODE_57261_length_281_cov_0.846154_1_plen_55_part_01
MQQQQEQLAGVAPQRLVRQRLHYCSAGSLPGVSGGDRLARSYSVHCSIQIFTILY